MITHFNARRQIQFAARNDIAVYLFGEREQLLLLPSN
jgi:hypothetical protein